MKTIANSPAVQSISSVETLQSLKYNDLAKWAASNGIKMMGLKKEELLQTCISSLTPQIQKLNISEAKTEADLIQAGLTQEEVGILIHAADLNRYDDVLDSVIERSGLDEEDVFRISGLVFDNFKKLAKKAGSKSARAIELYKEGKRLVDIADILDMHSSFVFTVISKYRKSLNK